MLGRVFSARLDLPDNFGDGTQEKRDKEFCVGLLSNPVSHAWWPIVSRLGHRERCSVSGTMFMMRKVLPSPPDPMAVEKHARLMSSPAAPSPPDFLDFVDRKIDEMFEVGWDRAYASHVYKHTPTSSSCLEVPRSAGGVRQFLSGYGPDWFADQCLGECPRPSVYPVRYTVVRTGGKNRGVTVSSGYSSVLGPLHRTLYDHLSRFEWLLRGEARAKKFKGFQRKEGEVFVSGDYESATDNLSLSLAGRILSRVLSRCRWVPCTLREYALRSLEAEISYEGRASVRQKRGQLMGNFLSFPLLCLQNFLAFSFLIPRPVPVRINGDDIVFRCRPAEYDRWREGVAAAGLVLCKGKTLVNRSLFSLNSAFFDAQSRRVREIPILRSTSLMCQEGLPTPHEFTKYCRNWKLEARRLVGGLWLRAFRPQIQASGRSVCGGLGIPADNSQLHTAGLADREAFFRGKFLALQESPLPPSPHDFSDPREGKEWTLVRAPVWCSAREKAEYDESHRAWCVRHRWEGVERATCEARARRWADWWADVRRTGYQSSWLSWKLTASRARRLCPSLGLSLREVARRRAPAPGVWIPASIVPQYLCSFPGVGCRS